MNPSGRIAYVTEPDPRRPGYTRSVIAYYLPDAAGGMARVTKRQFRRRHKPKPVAGGDVLTTHGRTTWPKTSESLACHPNQVKEAQARADRHGISVTYTPRGDVVVPDRGNWLKLLKLEGFHEKS